MLMVRMSPMVPMVICIFFFTAPRRYRQLQPGGRLKVAFPVHFQGFYDKEQSSVLGGRRGHRCVEQYVCFANKSPYRKNFKFDLSWLPFLARSGFVSREGLA